VVDKPKGRATIKGAKIMHDEWRSQKGRKDIQRPHEMERNWSKGIQGEEKRATTPPKKGYEGRI